MKIDIEKLKELMRQDYAERAELADKCKSDRAAIRALTSLETRQLRDESIIDDFEFLVESYQGCVLD